MMSDPMTKVEIEDVLSSIRRLVSEEQTVPQGAAALRPEPSRPAAVHPRPVLSAAPVTRATEAEEMAVVGAEEFAGDGETSYLAPEPLQDLHEDEPHGDAELSEPRAEPGPEDHVQPDPLVLTPALRVADRDSASLRASLEETIAELEAAISGSGGDWEPDGSEQQSPVEFDEFAASLATAVSAGPAALDDAAEAGTEAEAGIGAAPEEVVEVETESDSAGLDIVLQDAGPAAQEASPAPAESPVRLVSDSGDARPEGLWSQYPETLEWSAPGDLAEDEAIDAAASREPHGLELAPEEPETSALEELEAVSPEEPEAAPEPLSDAAADAYADPEPDLADRFWAAEAEDMDPGEPDFPETAPRAEAPDWQDNPVPDTQPRRLHLAGGLGWGATPPVSAAGRGWLRGEPEETDLLEADEDDEDGLFDDVEETVLDEAALRALVSEIIRQELQGTLGERITRSVRKLVRREIQRALASRDFE